MPAYTPGSCESCAGKDRLLGEMSDDITRLRSESIRAEQSERVLLAALKELLEDSHYQVAIGGNPNAVQAMLARATAAIAKAEAK